MTDNVVQIRIKASDTAKPDVTDLKAKLDELGAKVETARVDVEDKDAVARLLALNAKLAALDKRVANPHITVAGAARVEAELAAVDASLSHADKKAGDLKSRLLALGGTAGVLSGLGDMMGVFNKDASTGTKLMSGFSTATGLLEAPLSGLVVGVGGLVAGLAAAGTGLLAFGAVAKSQFTVASTAANQVQTAQTAYTASVAKASSVYQQQMAVATTAAQKKSAATKQATALQSAEAAQVKATTAAYAQMTPAQIALSKQIGNAQNAWQSFVQSNTSGVAKIMSQGIGLLPKVFASMQPFMAPVEKALGGLIGQLGKGLGSSGFKSFIDMLAGNAGPAITKLGQSVGHIVVGFGGIIRAFMPFAQIMLGGLDKITAKFATWGQTLTQHSGFQSLVAMAQADMPLVIQVVKNLGAAIMNLGKSMTGLSTFSNSKTILQMAVVVSQLLKALTGANPALTRFALYALAAGGAVAKLKPAFAGISAGIGFVKDGASALQDMRAGFSSSAAAASEATGIWGTFGGRISTAVEAIKGWAIWSKIAAAATRVWTAVQAAFDVVMDANPVMLIVIAIAALIAVIVLCAVKFGAFRAFWKAAWHDIESVFDAVRHAIAAGFDFIVHAAGMALSWIKSHWPLLLAILTGPIGIAVLEIARHWDAIRNGASRAVSDVTGFFRSLPGRILSALGDLGSLLWNAGAAVINGLIGGIESMFGSLGSVMGSVASKIAGFIGLSPAREGPLSAGGAPQIRGQHIARDIAAGMASGTSLVAAAAGRLAGAAAPGAVHGPAYAGSAGTAGGLVTLRIEGSDSSLVHALVLALRKEIRVQGGDVQAVLGHS